MGKKEKNLIKKNLDKVTETVTKEINKAQEQLNSLVGDLMKQAEAFQSEVTKPFRKMLKEMEALREKEMKRLQTEYQRMLDELQELQQQFLDRVGLSRSKDRCAPKTAEPQAKPATTGEHTAQNKPAQTASQPKKSTAKSGKTGSARKKVDIDDLTQLTGIGPAVAKKLNAAGIHSLKQIAEPSEDDQAILAQFTKVRHHEKWQDEARALLAG